MNDKVLEFGTMTYENLKKAHERITGEEKQKIYTSPIVFLSNGDFKHLDYLSIKYPKGAIQISKIDKKKIKNKSFKYKRYFIKQVIHAIDKVIIYEQEALSYMGIKFLPCMNYGEING